MTDTTNNNSLKCYENNECRKGDKDGYQQIRSCEVGSPVVNGDSKLSGIHHLLDDSHLLINVFEYADSVLIDIEWFLCNTNAYGNDHHVFDGNIRAECCDDNMLGCIDDFYFCDLVNYMKINQNFVNLGGNHYIHYIYKPDCCFGFTIKSFSYNEHFLSIGLRLRPVFVRSINDYKIGQFCNFCLRDPNEFYLVHDFETCHRVLGFFDANYDFYKTHLSRYELCIYDEANEHFKKQLFMALYSNEYTYSQFCSILLLHDIELNPGPVASIITEVHDCTCNHCSSDYSDLLSRFTQSYMKGRVSRTIVDELKLECDKSHGKRHIIFTSCVQVDANFEMQMLNRMFGPIEVKATLDDSAIRKIDELADSIAIKAQDLFDNTQVDHQHVHTIGVSALGNKLYNGMDGLLGAMSNPTTLSCVVAALLAMNFAFPSPGLRTITSIVGVWALYHLGSTKFLPMIMNLLSGFTMQSLEEDIVEVMGELICFSFFGHTIKWTTFSAFTESFGLFERNGSTLDRFLKRLTMWFKKVFAILGDHFGIECFQTYGEYKNRLENIRGRFTALNARYMMHMNQIADAAPFDAIVNMDFCNQVKELDDHMREIMISLSDKDAASGTVRKCLAEIRNRMTPMLRIAEQFGADAGKRIPPFVMCLVGITGVGKTYVLEDLCSRVNTVGRTKADLIDLKNNPSARIYGIQTGQKHYDAAGSKSVYIIPDAFTASDVKGKPGEAEFIINNIGSNKNPLPAAALENKDRINSHNRVLGLGSNQCYLTSTVLASINNPEAVIGRLNTGCWRVIPTKEYCGAKIAGTNMPPGETDPRFCCTTDKAKIQRDHPGRVFMDATEFIAWDVGTNKRRTNELQTSFYGCYDKFCEYMMYKMQLHIDIESANLLHKGLNLENTIDNIIVGMPDDGVFRPPVFVPQTEEDDSTMYSADSIVDHFDAYDRGELNSDDVEDVISSLKPHQKLTVAELLSKNPKFYEYATHCYNNRLADRPYEFYNGDINHGYTLLVEKLSMVNLEHIVKSTVDLPSTLRDTISSTLASYYSKGCDAFSAALQDCIGVLGQFIANMNERIAKPILWCLEHPIISSVIFGGMVAASFWAMFKLLSALCGTISSNIPDDMGDTVFVVQNDTMDKHSKAVLQPKSQTYYQIVLVRTRKSDGLVVRRAPCTLRFVSDFVGKTVAHLFCEWQRLLKLGDTNFKIYLSSYNNTNALGSELSFNYKFDIEDLKWQLNPDGLDLAFITFPKSKLSMQSYCIDEYPDINDKAFMSWLKTKDKKQAVALIKLSSGFKYVKCNVWYEGDTISYNYNSIYGDKSIESKPFKHIANTLRSDLAAVAGWCGSEVWLIDPGMKQFGKQYSNPIPIYSHIGMTSAQSVGILMTRQEFANVDKALMSKSKHTSDEVLRRTEETKSIFMSKLREYLNEVVPHDANTDVIVDKMLELADGIHDVDELPEIPKHANVLERVEAPKVNLSSSIKKSVLYHDLTTLYQEVGFNKTRQPIKTFKHYDSTGRAINPLANGLCKYGTNPQEIPLKQTEFIINKAVMHIHSVSKIPINRQHLTFEDFMLGMDGVRKKPKDSTSAGYTFTIIKNLLGVSGKGRTWIWSNEEGIDFSSPFVRALKATVEANECIIRKGQRITNINVDHMKDELRTFDKCEDGKARIYCAQELVYLILTGMYFYPFVSWMVDNRIVNGSLMGINPFGDEWRQFFTKLISKNQSGIFGDYGSYDKTLFVIWQRATQKLYKAFAGDDNPDLMAMDMLFEDMISSYHVINVEGKGYLYKWSWGNTSGNFLTTIINTVANFCLIVYACVSVEVGGRDNLYSTPVIRLAPIVNSILQDIAFGGYGDDNAFTITPDHDLINFFTIRDAFAEIGIEYTDELKGKGELLALKPVVDGSMIGRGFYLEPGVFPPQVNAPLRLYSILESLLWDKSGKESLNIVAQKSRMAAAELSQHPPIIFDTYYPIIRQSCQRHGIEMPEFDCREDALNFVRSIDYSLYD